MYRKLPVMALAVLVCIAFLMQLAIRKEKEAIYTISTLDGNVQNYAVYTKDGDVIFTNSLSGIKNPVGIVENPPAVSITSIREMVMEAVDNNDKVLILYIDGLGYELYEKAANGGYIPYLASLGKASKALTVYPPITDVTFASMVTGETPKHTGIHSREKKPVLADTM